MYLLDTDIVSLIFHHPGQQPLLESRILATPRLLMWVSVVSAEEMIQGAFALIRRNQQKGRGTSGYELLTKILLDLPSFQLLPYDDRDDALYRSLSAAVKRLGRGDCQIAASAIRHGYTVITRNTRHFRQIPNVQCVDWTI